MEDVILKIVKTEYVESYVLRTMVKLDLWLYAIDGKRCL